MAVGSKAGGDGDVRRRRSHEYESDDHSTSEHGRDGSHVARGNVDRAPYSIPHSENVPGPSGPASAEYQGRSRTSSDEARIAGSTKRKSDEICRGAILSSGYVGNAASAAEPLSLDIQAATRLEDMRRQGLSPGSVIQASPTSPTSPSSFRSRHRGMSLRTSLFNRNLGQTTQTGDSIIEMQNVPSSSQSLGTDYSKKDSQAAVNVVPVQDGLESDELDPVPAHGQIRLPSTRSAGTSSRNGLQSLLMLPNYRNWIQARAHRHLPVTRVKKAYHRARKFLLRIREIAPSKNGRHIPLNSWRESSLLDERTGKPFINNFIKSSKYTPWNFLPRQLFAQFSKLANLYFLSVSILQMIPGLSTTGTYTTIIPLMAFVSISMAKEGYEDFRRHRLDKTDNSREARVLRIPQQAGTDYWISVKWQTLQVGDIVKVDRDEAAPADILLLDTKGANNIAYIETMALDGETNLKPKQPSGAVVGRCSSVDAITDLRNTEIVVEDPNLDLYNFEGKISIDDAVAPLTNNEIVYRGSILRNTPSVIGIIVYSGEECKIRMNANKHPRVKAPSLQGTVNRIVIFMVLFVLFLALFNTIAYQIWHISFEDHAWYLNNAHVAFAPVIISFIIMFNTLIPLSLYVSLEIIKVSQMFLMNVDADMYDAKSNTPFEARTSTINEELGQVSYIFSDKTGTLTENVMKFRKLSVAGAAWLHDADLKETEHQVSKMQEAKVKGKRKGRLPFRKSANDALNTSGASESHSDTDSGPRRSTATWRSAVPGTVQPEITTTDMIRYIQKYPRLPFSTTATMMILAMALCHTCLPERNSEDKVTYQASSPDEAALVQAASELGMIVYNKEAETLTIKTYPNGLDETPMYENYEVLDVIEFSSIRKRMSVIMRFPDGRICVICKGADSVITERLRLATLAHSKIAEIEQRVSERRSVEAQEELRRRSENVQRKNSVGNFARTSVSLPRGSIGDLSLNGLAAIRGSMEKGSRAASLSIRSLSTPRPSGQLSRPSAFSQADQEDLIQHITARDDSTTIGNCFQHITSFATEGLRTLVYGHRFVTEEEYRSWKKIYHEAVTSLTDRQNLIERAGELIEQCLELTGATAIEDKLQQGVPDTIERLRRANIKMWMLTGDKRETAINIGHSCGLIKEFSTVIVLTNESGAAIERHIAAVSLEINRGRVAHSVIVIDGRTLATIQGDESLHTPFIDLAILADSVICCRASPSQKAHLVHAVRRRVNRSVTLAIGDGANDIAMIQEAHVGIGITGKEGLQAARTADYAIAQFRFLSKLLLVHGHWNYVRTCKYTLATFWKEMLFYVTQATYQRWNGYTGTSLYEQWSLSQFNTLFTSLPVIFLGIFEQDLQAATLIAIPELYCRGQRFAGFNFRVYLSWIFMAACEAMVVFFTMKGLYGQAIFTTGLDLYSMGDLTFSACIVIINCKIQLLEQRNRTVIALFCLCVEIGGWFLWNVALSSTYTQNNEYAVHDGLLDRFGRNPLWWLCLLVTVAACLLFEVTVRTMKNAFWPTDVEVFQLLEGDEGWRARFEEESGGELRRAEGVKAAGDELEKVQTEEQMVMIDDPGAPRGSVEIHEMLSRRFGSVRRGELQSAA